MLCRTQTCSVLRVLELKIRSVRSSFDINSHGTTPILKYFKEKQQVHFTSTGSTEEQYINVRETQRDNQECTQPCLYKEESLH